jgi:hypothetical protein
VHSPLQVKAIQQMTLTPTITQFDFWLGFINLDGRRELAFSATLTGKVTRYTSLTEAREAGIEAEMANGEMYERLIKNSPREDIVTVLENLQAASRQRHRPAFRRLTRAWQPMASRWAPRRQREKTPDRSIIA